MTRTDSQREASRRNGALSLGPVSTQGRLAAARNATQHGFSGAGKCLPPDMDLEWQAEIALYAAQHQPRNDYERDLVRRAALGNVRARRLAAAANALTDERTRNAVRHWDEARADAVAALTDRLDAEPEAAVRLLSRTAHGCDYLGDAWESLGHALTVAGHWDEPLSRRALRLLGLANAPTRTSPEPLWTFWLCVLSLRFEHDPNGLLRTTFRHWSDAESVRRYLPDPAEARAALAEFVRERVAAMESLGSRIWAEFDAPSRASAEARAAFDVGPESARLERYLKDAERMRRQALDELSRLRRDESPGRSSAAPKEPQPTPPPAVAESERRSQNEPEPTAPPPVRSTELATDKTVASTVAVAQPPLDRLVPAHPAVPTSSMRSEASASLVDRVR